jgi:ABC-type amino acid transport system permease subunit
MSNILSTLLGKIRSTRGAFLAALALLMTLGIAFPFLAGAQTVAGAVTSFFLGGVLGGTLAWVTYTISYIVTAIVGFFTAIIVYGIGVVLELNTNIINTPAVQEGFKVTLAIANLGFVLGIIVIAIATILRYEHYGVKRLLVKLIAAALLVNFSLVIGGSILNFADRMSSVFLTAFPGGGGTDTTQYGAVEGVLATVNPFHNFAKSFGGAFSPQRALMNPTLVFADKSSASAEDFQRLQGAGAMGQSIGQLFTPLINLVFVAAILIVMLITIATFFFMLLIRYIYLGMLLILMPFAWLLWVFPLTEGIWKKWWDKFLKWTFFAPIALFFLWLVIITAEVMNAGAGTNPLQGLRGLGYNSPADHDFIAGISSFVGGLANQVLGTFLQAAVLVGLSLGGLIAAEKFSITGSHAAMGAVKKIGAAAQGYAVRRGRQLGGKVLQKAGAPGLANKLMTGSYGEGSSSRAARIFHGVAKWTGLKLGGQKLGEAMQQLEVGTTGGLVKDEAENVKKETAGMTDQQKANLVAGANMPRRIALLEMAAKEGWADKVDAKYYDSSQKPIFKRYGKEKTYEDVNKAALWAGETRYYLEAVANASKDLEKTRKEAEEVKRKELTASLRSRIEGEPVPENVHFENTAAKEAWITRRVEEELKKPGPASEIGEAGNQAVATARAKGVMVDEIDPETGKPVIDPATGKSKRVDAQQKADEIIAKRTEELKKNDKVQYKEIFGDKAAFGLSKESVKMMGEIFAEKVARMNQQLVPNIISKLNAQQLRSFEKLYKRVLNEGIAATSGTEREYLEKGLENFEKKILAHHMTGLEHEEGTHPPEPAPAPTPPSGGEHHTTTT